jgi:hypothetical protein
MDSSKKNLELIKYSVNKNLLMFSVSPKVTDMQVSLKDGVLDTYKRNLTEVIEKSVVSVLGIQPESPGLLPELVKMDIIIELNLTKKSIELEELKEPVLKTVLLLKLISLKRISHQWVVSHTTVLLEMIS